jgi:hypothetical protein
MTLMTCDVDDVLKSGLGEDFGWSQG